MSEKNSNDASTTAEKPCRACFDFKSWMKMQNKDVKSTDEVF